MHGWMTTLTASAALVMLAACGKSVDEAATSAGAAVSAAANSVKSAANGDGADTEASTSAKLNAYTQGYNKLIGTFGLPETQERYLKMNIAKRKASENLSITDGWIDLANEQLKKGRKLAAPGLDELDKSGDTLIASLDSLVGQLKDLHVYYEGKAYKDDDLAKGKAADAKVREAFASSTTAMKQFSDVLGREEKKRSAAVLAKLKASGDMLGYGTKLGLQQAEEIVGLFDNEQDIRDPAKYQAADAQLVLLEKTLDDQRAAYEAAKNKEPAPDSAHESTATALVSFVGSYRAMKQSKEPKAFNEMVKKYNGAVERANRLR